MPQGATALVSVNASGNQGNGHSDEPSVSENGRFVAFASLATNLVAGDSNGLNDVFVRDEQTGVMFRVSVSSGSGQANGQSRGPAISPDGGWVVFDSEADNLVSGDTNSARDVFVRDRSAMTTVRVSVSSGGAQGNTSSGAGGIGAGCDIADGGQVVAFASLATNLVPGDVNGSSDIFVRELVAGTTTRVSVGTGGSQGTGASSWPSMSGDGRFIAFESTAPDLVPGDTNGKRDVFVHDRQTGETVRASIDSLGVEGNGDSREPSISADGRCVTFMSEASNLTDADSNGVEDVFVHDLAAGATVRVSVSSSGSIANGWSATPRVSSDGAGILFRSSATNLVAGDTNGVADVFLHLLNSGQTLRVSEGPLGAQANAACELPALSMDGRTATFASTATTLVSMDTNNKQDVFVRVVSSWVDAGIGLPGVAGVPSVLGTGTLMAGGSASLNLSAAAPNAPCVLFVSLTSAPVPFKGGMLYAFPALLQVPLLTNGGGSLQLPFVWPGGVPAYVEFFFQYAILDGAALNGISLSNAISGLST